MSDHDSNRNPIDLLGDEFLDRVRKGERPPLSEYTEQHPELADEIRELFPVLLEMEDARPTSESGSTDNDGSSGALPSMKELGDYRIIREVGRGGMGIVYEAEQISLGRRVALKVLPQQMLLNSTHQRRFEREARAAGKLHHTNIVPVFGVGRADGYHFYVMQFIAGMGLDEVIGEVLRMHGSESSGDSTADGSLRVVARDEVSAVDVAQSLMTGQFQQTLVTDGSAPNDSGDTALPAKGNSSDSFTVAASSSIPGGVAGASGGREQQAYWHSVARIGRQVADALDYAHRQGILHRDIKPGNLLLDLRGTVWVTDFGLAKASDQQDITHTGDILGTLRYMPPEAFDGVFDSRSDIYSLGVTLYELLALQPAYVERDRHKLIKLVTTSEPARLEKLNSEVPRDLTTIVHKAIDRDASHRYQTAAELAEDLQRCLDDEPIKARRTSVLERFARWSRRNRSLSASLSAVCILLLVISIAVPMLTWRAAQLDEQLETSGEDLNRKVGELEEREQELTQTIAALEDREEELRQTLSMLSLEEIAELDLNDLVELQPDDPRLLAELARQQALHGAWEEAANSIADARRLAEMQLDESPSAATALFLADLMLAESPSESGWTTLDPIAMESVRGAVLTRLDDHSILASGKSPERDTYNITAKLPHQSLHAIRLEVLPHPSLPHRGPGRFPDNGNFTLTEFQVQFEGARSPSQDVLLQEAVASTEQTMYADANPYQAWTIASAIDGDALGNDWGWSILDNAGTGSQAVFLFGSTVDGGNDGRLIVTLEQQYRHQWHTLGRFRLSVSDDPSAFELARQCFAAMRIEDPWEKLEAAYAVTGDASIGLTYRVKWHEKKLDEFEYDGWWLSERSTYLLDLARQEELYAALVRARPTDGHLQIVLGRHNALLERWDAAADAFCRGIDVAQSDSEECFEYACLLLINENTEAFEDLLTRIDSRFAETTDPRVAYTLARLSCLSPQSLTVATRAVERAEIACRDDLQPWHLHALGLAQFRARRLDAAVTTLQQSNSMRWNSHWLNWVVLAMVHHELGNSTAAAMWLERAGDWHIAALTEAQGSRVNVQPIDWMSFNVLLREAHALIDELEVPAVNAELSGMENHVERPEGRQ